MAGSRIGEEKRTVEAMIRLYCRRKEGNRDLCAECRELLGYTHSRLDRCKYGDNKPTCERCSVHCYRLEMRERVRRVMRYAGPRMLLFHPLMAVKHLVRKINNKTN